MNNERIQVSHVEASSRVQAPEILITGGNSIKVYDTSNQKMGAISFQDADFIFYTDINGIQYKTLRASPENIEDGTIAHNSVVVHKNNVNETVSGVKTFSNNIQVSGTGIFNAIDLNNIDNLSLSGVDITITSGVVALTNRPTVNGTGVLLSGQNTFVVSFTHDEMNMNNNSYFFSNLNGIDASTNKDTRTMTMMQPCQARFAAWSTYTRVAREQDSTTNPSTGYFINNTTNTSGVITNQYRHAVNGTFYSFTGAINPPIDINFGDKVQIGLRVPNYTIGMSAVHNTVDITFFN